MKKKIIVINLFIIILLVLAIGLFYKRDDKFLVNDDNGVVYAINLNGTSVKEFPGRDSYRVDVLCTNATARWDYVNWELNIDNVKGNVSCEIDFTSVEKESLSTYLKKLDGSVEGDGKFLRENSSAQIPDYSKAVVLKEDEYGTLTTFSSSNDAFETSGSSFTDTVLTFQNEKWTTTKMNLKNWMFNHFQFQVKEDSYYEVCYNFGAGNTSNRLWIYSGESSILDSLRASTSTDYNDCIGVGFVSTDSYIKIVQAAVGSADNNRSALSFDIRKVPSSANSVKTLDADYRYEGKDPNNYILYNDELWRIIGVFDERSHGQTGKDLVKIIRHNSLNALTFNIQDSNEWNTTSLKTILNDVYYNKKMGSSSCFGYSTTSSSSSIPTTCDYSGIGLTDYSKSLLVPVSWYWGGASNGAVTALEMYESERKAGKDPVTASVGLMYASDYGYSVLESDCSRNNGLNLYNSEKCANKSWLSGFNWTMSTNDNKNDFAFQVNYNGALIGSSVRRGVQIKPVVYLDSSVYYVDGDGSPSDPFIVAK